MSSMATLDSFSTANSSSVNLEAKPYLTYIVGQGDTLEGIAQRELGDWARWREIAALNSLRYPFISDRADLWFGPESTTGLIPEDLPFGAQSLRVSGENKEFIPAGSTFFMDGYAANTIGNSVYVYDAITIASFNQSSGAINFIDGKKTTQAWQRGTRYRVFPPMADQDAHVGRPGERILLPILTIDLGNILDRNAALTLYGSDIALGFDGKLSLSNGDLATVSGFDNISQALRFRSELPYGSYIVHTDEGNRCHYLIGEPIRAETPLRAAAFVKAALSTDPRVDTVTDVIADFSQADAINLTASVLLARTQESISVNTILRGRQ